MMRALAVLSQTNMQISVQYMYIYAYLNWIQGRRNMIKEHAEFCF